MAGFGVLWRVWVMSNWISYAYCRKCDRPLRWNEHRRLLRGDPNYTRGGTHYCWYCDSPAWKPITFLGFRLWDLLALSACISAPVVIICVYYSWQSGSKETPAPNWAGIWIAFLFVIMVGLVGGLAEGLLCKRIYNRWVMQHGKNPANWPSASI